MENRLRHLLASGEATSVVLAPVPWFPSGAARFGDWAVNARAPRAETRHGISILHPRYPVIPRIGMSAAPWLLYRAMIPQVGRLLAEGHRFDAIDAHYVYPDGVAACWLGRRFGLPVVITARGTDVNLIPRHAHAAAADPGRHPRCRRAGRGQCRVETGAGGLGAPDDKVTVLRNGVETGLFRPPADRPPHAPRWV